jgi:hypothetical protein
MHCQMGVLSMDYSNCNVMDWFYKRPVYKFCHFWCCESLLNYLCRHSPLIFFYYLEGRIWLGAVLES